MALESHFSSAHTNTLHIKQGASGCCTDNSYQVKRRPVPQLGLGLGLVLACSGGVTQQEGVKDKDDDWSPASQMECAVSQRFSFEAKMRHRATILHQSGFTGNKQKLLRSNFLIAGNMRANRFRNHYSISRMTTQTQVRAMSAAKEAERAAP